MFFLIPVSFVMSGDKHKIKNGEDVYIEEPISDKSRVTCYFEIKNPIASFDVPHGPPVDYEELDFVHEASAIGDHVLHPVKTLYPNYLSIFCNIRDCSRPRFCPNCYILEYGKPFKTGEIPWYMDDSATKIFKNDFLKVARTVQDRLTICCVYSARKYTLVIVFEYKFGNFDKPVSVFKTTKNNKSSVFKLLTRKKYCLKQIIFVDCANINIKKDYICWNGFTIKFNSVDMLQSSHVKLIEKYLFRFKKIIHLKFTKTIFDAPFLLERAKYSDDQSSIFGINYRYNELIGEYRENKRAVDSFYRNLNREDQKDFDGSNDQTEAQSKELNDSPLSSLLVKRPFDDSQDQSNTETLKQLKQASNLEGQIDSTNSSDPSKKFVRFLEQQIKYQYKTLEPSMSKSLSRQYDDLTKAEDPIKIYKMLSSEKKKDLMALVAKGDYQDTQDIFDKLHDFKRRKLYRLDEHISRLREEIEHQDDLMIAYVLMVKKFDHHFFVQYYKNEFIRDIKEHVETNPPRNLISGFIDTVCRLCGFFKIIRDDKGNELLDKQEGSDPFEKHQVIKNYIKDQKLRLQRKLGEFEYVC